jgi:chromosome partitioning protein
MRVVAVINYKGGVGKTTVTCNLGAALAAAGKRVLMIDLDPQASLTFSFVTPDEWAADFEPTRTIKAWFDGFQQGQAPSLADLAFPPPRVNSVPAVKEAGGRIELICSHLGLLNVDLELAAMLSAGTLQQARRSFLRVHRSLKEGLAAIDPNAYDVVLIDCPPNFNIVTKTAIIASDAVLVPARPDYLSTLGIAYLLGHVNELVRDHNDYAAQSAEAAAAIAPEVLGVIFTMVREYGRAPIAVQHYYIEGCRSRGVPVFEGYMRDNPTVFANAAPTELPVALQRGAAAKSAAEELAALAAEFRARLGA